MAEGEEYEMGLGSSSVKWELFPERGSSVDKPQFSLLLKICKANGESLPYGVVNNQLVVELFQNTVGQLPSQTLVLYDQDVLVEFPMGAEIHELSRAVHGPAKFRDTDIYIGCIMAMRDLLISAEREREELRMQQDDLEREKQELEEKTQQNQETIKEEKEAAEAQYDSYRKEMDSLNKKVKESLQLLETTRQAAEREMYQHSFSGTSQHRFMESNRIAKPPTFPMFSGNEPTPKDECSIQTFLFQVRSARQDVTNQAVRNALISALRGPASEFVEYIGLTSPLDTIIKEMEERFVRNIPPDALVCEFHQLQQGRHEKIKEFAGRIEKLYKKLMDQLPDRYPDKALMKDHLFYGMHPYMRDSLRFLFQKPEIDYTQLLKAASAAEIESERGRAMGLHSKASLLNPENELVESKEPPTSPMMASVAAMELKIEQLATIVKSTQKTKASNAKSREQSPKVTPKKSTGPGTSAAGPFNKGKKPIHCWRCGSWGHTSCECPTQGNVNWKELNGSKDLPATNTKPDLKQKQ